MTTGLQREVLGNRPSNPGLVTIGALPSANLRAVMNARVLTPAEANKLVANAKTRAG